MRIPTRKPGVYTNQKPDPNLTEEKFNEVKAHLERLKKYSQPKAAEDVDRLAKLGDFSENEEYSIAKSRLRGINRKIFELGDLLKLAVIIKPNKNTNTVELGHKVTVEVNGERKTFQILGSEEINPDRGVISNHSPIGAALVGRKVGERVRVQIGDKEVEYVVVGIE